MELDDHEPAAVNSEGAAVEEGAAGMEVESEIPSGTNGVSSEEKTTCNGDGLSEEEIKLWSTVKEKPSDFNSWTTLLQLVEQKGKLAPAREVFDAFFKVYPYCYGYWKKFADLEKKLSSVDNAREVYERGVQAVPLSIDLWVHYIKFSTTEDPDKKEDIRSLYQRAVGVCGLDYRSGKLWDLYLSWEKENGSPRQVVELYDQVLAVPLLKHQQYIDSFKQFVEGRPVSELVSQEELDQLKSEVEGDEDVVEKAVREKICEKRTNVFEKCKLEVEKRTTFEDGIKRPYFHVKPLERAQLRNWREYLDFEIAEGDKKRILVLFERCMIACALYEDFWMKFAKYAEDHCVDTARSVYTRACTVHLPRKPSIHLSWAAFEEKNGCPEKARDILRNIDTLVPGLAFVRQRRVGLEVRLKEHLTAGQLYQESVARADSAESRNFYAWRYARFLAKVLGEHDKATKVLQEAIDKDPINATLYLQLLDLESSRYPLNEGAVEGVFQQVQESGLSEGVKHSFALRRSQFLEEFGSNITKILQVQEECQKLKKTLKRRASSMAADTDSEASKKVKVDTAAVGGQGTPSAVAAVTTPTSQSTPTTDQQQQWAAYQQQWGAYNYGQQGYNYQQYYPQYPAQYGQTQ